MASGDASEATTNSAGPDLMSAFVQPFERRQTRRAYQHDLKKAFGRSTLSPSDLAAVSADAVALCVWGPDNERNAESSSPGRRQAAVKRFLLWLREPPQHKTLCDTEAAKTVQALSAPLRDNSA